ncbi:MAG: hypothetical protein IPH82_13640 [Chloroflexi bacterium]|nr:hypothetical protein [Chloroflexota bacterium]
MSRWRKPVYGEMAEMGRTAQMWAEREGSGKMGQAISGGPGGVWGRWGNGRVAADWQGAG